MHSRLVFLSRNYNCFKTDFENVKGGLENSIQMSIKKFIGLPKHTSTAFFYADQKKGSLGLTSIKTEYAIQSLVGGLRMIRNPDINIVDLDLRRVASKSRKSKDIISLE